MKDVVLLADPNTAAWDFSEKIQNHIRDTKEKEVRLDRLEITVFGDDEFLPHVVDNIRKKDVYLIQSSNKNPGTWLTELVLTKNLCLKADVNSLSLVLPYMRFVRQDRKHQSRVPISTRAVADAISPGLKRIITMDLHSPQIENAYPENVALDNLQSFPDLVRYLKENNSSYLDNLAIVSPDVGGAGRANSLYKRFLKTEKKSNGDESKYSLAIMSKFRDKPGSIEKMFLIGDVNKKNVLVVDDIIDSGNSGIKAADLLRKEGAQKLMFYATHGLFTKGTKDILNAYDVVMTSNTHYSPKEGDRKIEIIDMAPTFAEAIYRSQEGLSVSRLFD
ncbi:MAG TPA: ribose-phosphate diphosphokinase [Candidatus Pacearchaeota archaeon]|jgi:ribose-phosphate pyrophosphokinase|nr:ribose-phosphate diphosphokinase [Candidatus Pacearchaeota archaeon]